MKTEHPGDEARWFALLRRSPRVGLFPRALLVVLLLATLADVAWEWGRPDQAQQLLQRGAIVLICFWCLTEQRRPNHVPDPTFSSGTSRAGHEPRRR
jgi:hypothetical protein